MQKDSEAHNSVHRLPGVKRHNSLSTARKVIKATLVFMFTRSLAWLKPQIINMNAHVYKSDMWAAIDKKKAPQTFGNQINNLL